MGEVIAFPSRFSARRRPGMVWIEGGAFRMGSDRHYADEAPAHLVAVDGFWMDAAPVSNRAFARFVEETGWITLAELPPDPELCENRPSTRLRPGSMVFTPAPRPTGPDEAPSCWRYTPDADWLHPLGPDSNLEGLWDHPVVHVTWLDVEAYSRWAGVSVPTEAEWEYAARGGLNNAEYAWGDEPNPGGQQMANTWRGRFPFENLEPAASERTTRPGEYPPNGYGLYDMIGNVWEWTADWWSAHPPRTSENPSRAHANPVGGERWASVEPRRPGAKVPRKVLKGGSHLCGPSHCPRYRPAARQPHPIDTAACHIGFRCVRRDH